MKEYTREQQRKAHLRMIAMWRRVVRAAGHEGEMKLPVFELGVNTRNWGYWRPTARTLSIHIKLATCDLYEDDFEDTMRHEIAHQWVSEVAQIEDEPPHGPMWRRACRIFSADPRATATCMLDQLTPNQRKLSSKDEKVLRKIKKLLALSESGNIHEAELAALRARELMLKHHVEQLDDDRCQFDFRTLGRPRKRRPAWYLLVANILRDHFQVQVIWLREVEKEWDGDPETPGYLMEMTGTPASVEIAEYVHDFLLAEGERLFKRYQGETGDYSKPVRRKNRFLLGLYEGFYNKLEAQSRELEASAGSCALINAGEVRLERFWRSRYPRVVFSGSPYSGKTGDEYHQGRAQGQKMSIRQGVGGPASRGKLLSD